MSVFADVQFAGVRDTPRLTSLRVTQAMGQHEVGVVEMEEAGLSSRSLYSGTQVRLRWGRGVASVSSLPGYVNHYEPEVARTARTVTNRVVVVGPTYLLKSAGQRAYLDTTLDRVVREVANRVRFATVADPGPTIRDIYQAGRSYWQWLVEEAEEDGMLLWPRATSLHLRDPKRLEQEAFPTAAWIDTVHAFRPVLGETLGGDEHARRISMSLDGTDIVVRDSSWSGNDHRDRFVRTPLLVTYEDRGIRQSEDANRYTYQAEVEVDGDPRLRPGTAVCLDGLGARGDGCWMVERAEHDVRPRDQYYRVTLTVGRAQAVDDGRRPRFSQGRRVIDPGTRGPRHTTVTTPQGVWVANRGSHG